MTKNNAACWLLAVAAAGCGGKGRKADAGDAPRTPSGDCGDRVNELSDADLSMNDASVTPSEKGAYLVKLSWLCGPKARTPALARLIFADAQRQKPSSVAEVTVKPWMPTMGHGSSTSEQSIAAAPNNPQVYHIKGVNFTMGGAWVLKVSATVNGQADQATIPVDVP